MTTIARLHERAQAAFHEALDGALADGKWDPILADEYRNREADLRWEEAELRRAAVMDAIADRDGMTEAEARAAWGDR